ncbi:hypothetical protein Baya_13571 [Bagarius yarrelli]|uniref:Uncharacterized protein n=1 Tax=Bagarius yarrelli TaxID=175774 RepID=A0A556V6B9_BAGYA|nr:hypothetical protein Baya_13571 [Bagarius yarrelli]
MKGRHGEKYPYSQFILTLLNDPTRCLTDPDKHQHISPAIRVSITALNLKLNSPFNSSLSYVLLNPLNSCLFLPPIPLRVSQAPRQQSQRSTAIDQSKGHSTSFVVVVPLRYV